MNSRTRGFLVSSTAIVVVGLGVGLLAYYGAGAPPRASAVGPAELAYVPLDASAVAYANVRGIMNSEFRQRLQQVLPTGEERDKIETELGINFERDIDTLVAGLSIGGPTAQESGVVLVRGRINFTHIEGKALEHGAVAEEYRGKRLYVTANPGDRDHPESRPGFALLEGDLVGIGPIDGLRRAIDAAASSQNVTGNPDMMRFISQLDSASDAWIVGKFDAVSQSASLPAEVRDRIPPVQWVSASARMNGGLAGTLNAETRDDQSGDQLRDVVRGALAAAQLMTGQDPRLDALVKSVQVQGVGKTVTVTFNVPVELLDIINGLAAAKRLSSGR
ncbi:MAG TPA: hypothetical protein VMM93_10810 [Vicinamibacterales bacterium]|nr:hypothetical protein [Vicinamibacterales bacterium]